VLRVSAAYVLARSGMRRAPIFLANGRRIAQAESPRS
jgi:hypothetical protein